MTTNKENSKEQVNELVNRMLSEVGADDLQEMLSDMYMAYNSSEFADDRRQRSGVYHGFCVMLQFVSNLQRV